MIRNVFFDSLKTLGADNVLYTAGIIDSGLLINAKVGKPCGEQLMALINHICYLFAGIGQIDVTFRPHGNHIFFHANFSWLR